MLTATERRYQNIHTSHPLRRPRRADDIRRFNAFQCCSRSDKFLIGIPEFLAWPIHFLMTLGSLTPGSFTSSTPYTIVASSRL